MKAGALRRGRLGRGQPRLHVLRTAVKAGQQSRVSGTSARRSATISGGSRSSHEATVTASPSSRTSLPVPGDQLPGLGQVTSGDSVVDRLGERSRAGGATLRHAGATAAPAPARRGRAHGAAPRRTNRGSGTSGGRCPAAPGTAGHVRFPPAGPGSRPNWSPRRTMARRTGPAPRCGARTRGSEATARPAPRSPGSRRCAGHRRQGADEPGRVTVLLTAQRQPGQVQARGPALGALPQRMDLIGRQRHAERLVEQPLRLLLGKAQLLGPDLGQFPAGAQPGQWQLRITCGPRLPGSGQAACAPPGTRSPNAPPGW